MTWDRAKVLASALTAGASVLAYVAQLLKCQAEHEQFQSAVQALAGLAFGGQ